MIYDGIILTDAVWDARIRPLGAYRIADMLRSHGYNILVIDRISFLSEHELLDLLDMVISTKTLFLGYSSSLFFDSSRPGIVSPFNEGDDRLIRMNQHVLSKFPDIKIIYGGSFSHHMIDHGRHHNFHIDYIVRGMGETMMLDLVSHIKNKTEPNYSKIINPHDCQEHNMYLIDYDMKGAMYDFRHSNQCWVESDLLLPNESLPIEVSRGCIFQCAFCTYPLLGKNKSDLSYLRHEDHIYQDIVSNYEQYGITNYVIIDDTFNHRTDNIERMLKIRDKSKIDLSFMGSCRLDLLGAKPEQMQLLRDMNFNAFFFGIESLHYPAAKAIGKGGLPEKNVETLYKLRDCYNETNTHLAINAGYIIGLPGETPEIAEHWIDIMSKDDFPMDNLNLSCLSIGNGAYGESKMFSNPAKYGYEITPSGMYSDWKNDIWTRKEALAFTIEKTLSLYHSGRKKLDAYSAAGLTRLGFDFNKLTKTPHKEVAESEEIKTLVRQDSETYFSRLKDIIQKTS